MPDPIQNLLFRTFDLEVLSYSLPFTFSAKEGRQRVSPFVLEEQQSVSKSTSFFHYAVLPNYNQEIK